MMETDIMCDFETLGTEKDSVVLSVGLILFNRNTGELLKEYYGEFDVNGQIFYGRTIDPGTVQWWRHRDRVKEFERLMLEGISGNPSLYIYDVMEELQGKYQYIWSRGHLDFEILASLHGDEDNPLEYWRARDTRTLDIFQKQRKKNGHNALDDCKNQIEHVVEVIRSWSVRSAEKNSEVMASAPAVVPVGSPTS